MGAPSVTVRCPTCGEDLRVVLAPSPPTQWFPCPRCRSPVAVVVPRDPPPLYSWEVLPGLYPALPPPKVPRWRPRRAAAFALVATAVIAAVLAGFLAYYGVEAQAAGSFRISGTIDATLSNGVTVPASDARVLLTTEGNQSTVEYTGPTGDFAFDGVPTGGVTLNITLAGYSPVDVQSFVSTIYSSGNTGIQVTLSPGGPSNGTTLALSPFPDLETFVASIDSGVVLLFLAAGVAGGAAAITLRSDRPAIGIVGGGAGLFAPIALYFLALGPVFPTLVGISSIVAGLGTFCLAIRAGELARYGTTDLGP